MDFRSVFTELTSANQNGSPESEIECSNAEFGESSLKTDGPSQELKPQRLEMRSGKPSAQPSRKQKGKLSLASKIPFYLIASLLTATAIAKLWMLMTDPFADIRVGIPKEILWITVAFELWLAFEN